MPTANVIGGEMKLILESGGQEQSKTIPWGPEVRGPYAPEQSMARKPMKENETRPLKMYIPELNKVCDVQLRRRTDRACLAGRRVQAAAAPQWIRPPWSTASRGRSTTPGSTWTPRARSSSRSRTSWGASSMYRTTKEQATAPGGPVQFDLILDTVMKTARKIPDPEQTRHIKYRITLQGTDPAQRSSRTSRQTVPGDGGRQVVGHARGQDRRPDGRSRRPRRSPIPSISRPNALVTSDDARVESLAQRVTRGVVDPWEKATRINHWVFENIEEQEFQGRLRRGQLPSPGTSPATAPSTPCSPRPCAGPSEIPSRVVVGLIYVDDLEGFGYHMWNEVFVNHRWVALDPSLDQSTVDAVHIKLSESSLDGVSPFEAFLPLVRVMGRLGIEPIELRIRSVHPGDQRLTFL